MTKPTKWHVHPAKTQISLGIHPVWSVQNQQNGVCAQWRLRSAWASIQSDQSSRSAWRNLGFLATHWAHSEDSDQTGRCPCWSKSSLGAQSFCWFCHEAVHLISRNGSLKELLLPYKSEKNWQQKKKCCNYPRIWTVLVWFSHTVKCPEGADDMSRNMTKPTMWLCAQRRLRSAWASTQSDQSLRCALNG